MYHNLVHSAKQTLIAEKYLPRRLFELRKYRILWLSNFVKCKSIKLTQPVVGIMIRISNAASFLDTRSKWASAEVKNVWQAKMRSGTFRPADPAPFHFPVPRRTDIFTRISIRERFAILELRVCLQKPAKSGVYSVHEPRAGQWTPHQSRPSAL